MSWQHVDNSILTIKELADCCYGGKSANHSSMLRIGPKVGFPRFLRSTFQDLKDENILGAVELSKKVLLFGVFWWVDGRSRSRKTPGLLWRFPGSGIRCRNQISKTALLIS